MADANIRPWRWTTDLALAAAVTILGTVAMAHFELFELIHNFSRTHESWEIDEIILGLGLLGFVSVWYSSRRWRDAQLHLRVQTDLERHLRTSHDELSFLIQAAPGILYTCNPDRHFTTTFVSPSITAQIGYEPSEFSDTPSFWADHVHPEDIGRVSEERKQVLLRDYLSQQYRFRVADGSYRQVQDQLRLLRDSDGVPDRVVGFMYDISDRRDFEQRLRQVFEHSSSGIYIHADFEPIYASRRLLDMFGFAGQDDFLSIESTALLLAPEERARIWGYHQARLRGDAAPADYDFWALKRNGERFRVNNRSFVVDWNGKRAVCTTLFDLTDRLEAEESLAEQQHLMSSLLEQTHEGFWFIDLEGYTTDVNPAMCRILGRPREDVIGKSVLEFADAANQQIFIEQRELRKKNLTSTYEVELLRPDGTKVPCLNNATPLRTSRGDRIGSVGIWADITDLKSVQHKLQLEKERAQAASVAKSEFLAVASHEIRTPMNGVLGAARLLLETSLSPEQRRRVEIIKQSGDSLLALLNDILDLAKIEAGRVQIEKTHFDVREMMSSVSDLMNIRAQQKGLRYHCHIADDLPKVIIADLARTRQVLFNIIGNAIKFTDTGEVRVSLSQVSVDPSSTLIRVEVTDTGPGISDYAQQRVFEKFAQADASTTRKYGGTGLGLAVCRNFVQLMQGDIGVSSVLGQGSTFWFTFPCGIGDAREIVASETSNQGNERDAPEIGRRLHILLAEDNPINQEIARDTLERAGHLVDVAENGMATLDAVKRRPYDVILMDVRMPEMDGPTTTRNIRNLPGGVSQTPIIAVTADAMVGDKERFLAAGMNAHVSKPFDPDVLFSTIANCVGTAPMKNAPPPTPQPVTNSTAEDPLDLAVIGPLRDGKPDLWRRLVDIYLEDTPAGLASLERQLEAADCAAAHMTAHSLKSASANMGATRLADLFRQLEGAANDANLDQARALLPAIMSEFAGVSLALEDTRRDDAAA